MKVRFDPAAAAALAQMPPVPRRRMKAALAQLTKDASGRSAKLDVKRLDSKAPFGAYRLAVGEWRAGWFVRGDTLEVVRVFHRSEGYGWLERMYP